MELDHIEQLDFKSVSKLKMDMLLVVSGYESRCTFLVDRLTTDPLNKIVFAFKEKRNAGSRQQNDRHFKELKFDFHDASGHHAAEVVEKLESLLEHTRKNHLKILVDYSCMTKEWYAAIINYFVNWDFEVDQISLYFSYTPSVFEKPKRKRFFRKLDSPSLTEPGDTAKRPVALILGLGYDQIKAQELINRIRPVDIFAFYSDPSIDSRFVEEIERTNRDLLKQLPADHIIRYPLDDMRTINTSLKDLCIELRLHSQIILAPLGPKPFALACMLLSARYPDIWVWRVHTGQHDLYYEWRPLDNPLICKAVFKSVSDDRWA